MLVRPVQPADVTDVVRMVHELAAYERVPDECHLTEEQLSAALFGESPALFGHVAEGADGQPVGFAVWFLNFSTWRGTHGIYVEDLYVSPEARGAGAGRALLAALAGICVERGYQRLEWWVLNWNEPALAFYRTLGATPMNEWTVYRLTDSGMRRLASGSGT